jgi:hypothetical protein
MKNFKKRKFEEVAQPKPVSTPISDLLWTEKYAPTTLDDMVVQDKKVQEFSAFMASDKVKLLLL